MRTNLTVLALLASLSLAQAHGDKRPNGGPMEDVAGVHAELLINGSVLTINVLDEQNKPVQVAGFTASALVVQGTNRETLTLAPHGEAALRGETKQPIAKGAQITVMIKTATGTSGQARFKH